MDSSSHSGRDDFISPFSVSLNYVTKHGDRSGMFFLIWTYSIDRALF